MFNCCHLVISVQIITCKLATDLLVNCFVIRSAVWLLSALQNGKRGDLKMLVRDNVTKCRESVVQYFLAKLLNTVYSCSRHDVVAALLTSELRSNVMPLSKTFTLMWEHSWLGSLGTFLKRTYKASCCVRSDSALNFVSSSPPSTITKQSDHYQAELRQPSVVQDSCAS